MNYTCFNCLIGYCEDEINWISKYFETHKVFIMTVWWLRYSCIYKNLSIFKSHNKAANERIFWNLQNRALQIEDCISVNNNQYFFKSRQIGIVYAKTQLLRKWTIYIQCNIMKESSFLLLCLYVLFGNYKRNIKSFRMG